MNKKFLLLTTVVFVLIFAMSMSAFASDSVNVSVSGQTVAVTVDKADLGTGATSAVLTVTTKPVTSPAFHPNDVVYSGAVKAASDINYIVQIPMGSSNVVFPVFDLPYGTYFANISSDALSAPLTKAFVVSSGAAYLSDLAIAGVNVELVNNADGTPVTAYNVYVSATDVTANDVTAISGSGTVGEITVAGTGVFGPENSRIVSIPVGATTYKITVKYAAQPKVTHVLAVPKKANENTELWKDFTNAAGINATNSISGVPTDERYYLFYITALDPNCTITITSPSGVLPNANYYAYPKNATIKSIRALVDIGTANESTITVTATSNGVSNVYTFNLTRDASVTPAYPIDKIIVTTRARDLNSDNIDESITKNGVTIYDGSAASATKDDTGSELSLSTSEKAITIHVVPVNVLDTVTFSASRATPDTTVVQSTSGMSKKQYKFYDFTGSPKDSAISIDTPLYGTSDPCIITITVGSGENAKTYTLTINFS